jgi:dihydroorotase/N-acyl-D-amino-acid deacylase
LQVLEDRLERTRQGITTEIVGNCGFSPYPLGVDRGSLHDFANGILCGDSAWGWTSAKDYFQSVKDSQTTTDVVSLVGHGTLRLAVAGNRLGPLSESELDVMCQLLETSLIEGAAGLSTGLMYVPGSSAPTEELERLCRIVAKHGKIYASHIRSYATQLIEAVDEQLELARRTGCRLQISHLQAVGSSNWPLLDTALEKVELASAEGLGVAFDCYPYLAGSSVLTMLLPQWSLDGGVAAMLSRLRDLSLRKQIIADTIKSLPWKWSDVIISGVNSNHNQQALQHTLLEVGDMRGVAPVEAMLDLLIEENGRVNVILVNQSDENLRRIITHPLSMIASDSFYVKGVPHPRLYGTFPKFLGSCVREWKWLKIEQAVQKITDFPARTFGLSEKGRLAPGYFADVTVFDATAINSHATYESPTQDPIGIRYVFRRGAQVL